MESVASSTDHDEHVGGGGGGGGGEGGSGLRKAVVDRLVRALDHPLRLLDRSSESEFSVLGSTGNVYTVCLSTTPSCTCPDRTVPCKHIYFILIRVLGVPMDDSSIRRKTLRPCQLNRLLRLPVSQDSLAGATLRQRFHQLLQQKQGPSLDRDHYNYYDEELEKGTICPVCLEEILLLGREDDPKLLACSTCRNFIHEECLQEWKIRSCTGRRRGAAATCVVCRARWRTPPAASSSTYINLN
ncbi:mitogen-activated protein kinase kinase kinase 1 [Impatiens glandulifera]|uniref:mitogen-activated protein kinase kinase kinase 1 n=1 Tax=Impatiens glandulifera TaxID=253017 RepID=UPI001FB1232B|nr:mitogen-activated protein kinase kinase kinase 1 [Impatiens glandulifera]